MHVIRDADAGRVFYHRPKANEVVHVDVFHALTRLPPRAIGAAVFQAVESFGRRELAHYIDLQTAAGGGRATGKLTFGQRESLQQAHKNHVHLSLLLAERDLALVFFLVEEVERALVRAGVELRKIEHVVHTEANPCQNHDLSPWAAYTDSFLKPHDNNCAEPIQRERSYAPQLMHIADLLEEMQDLDELHHLLHTMHPTAASRGVPAPARPSVSTLFQARLGDTWTKLKGYGYVECREDRYRLSAQGTRLYDFITRSLRQIECDLRHYQRLGQRQALSVTRQGYGEVSYHRRRPAGHRTRPKPTERSATLAVVQTVTASLHDSLTKQVPWRVEERHLCFEAKVDKRRLDICLLIDASASMMGRRIKAAKVLAQQLIQYTDDRLAVISFQEERVEVAVPFTRNQTLLKSGLKSIIPSGLTPLALGLLTAARYVRKWSSRERALLIVITDGIPTMALAGGDPMEEVLQQAKDIGNQGFRLCCVGLEPNHRLLQRLAAAAGGSAHIIDEITTPVLLSIVEQERRAAIDNAKLVQKGRN